MLLHAMEKYSHSCRNAIVDLDLGVQKRYGIYLPACINTVLIPAYHCIFVWLTKIYPHVLRLSNSSSEKRLQNLYLTKTHDATGFGVVTEYLVNVLV